MRRFLHCVDTLNLGEMDAMRTLFCTLFVLLCCQYGVSYRIYILPETGAFCLGVFSGDDCITWSEYSARPRFVDHSTTLIFTPGIYYSYRTLSVANIKRFTMIGIGAQLQFRLSLSNIGVVHIYNSTFTGTNSPRVDVRSVQSFVMENCTLLFQTSSSYYTSSGLMYFYNSNLAQIIGSTFNKVIINVQSRSTLFVDRCTFINSSSATAITGDTYSRLTLNNSKFLNNYANRNGVVYTGGALTINNCLFDGNSVRYSSAAVVYSRGDVTVIGSSFIRNRASYVSSSSSYRPVQYAYYEGGSALRGDRNINISNCTFILYSQRLSSVIYSYRYSNYYGSQGGYRVYVAKSIFYHSSRSIYSYNDVTLVNSSFYNITSSGGSGGGVVYSTKTVTTINCEFINSTAINGNGGVIYSQLSQSLFRSVFIINSADYSTSRGGALYSQQGNISITNCSISNSIANGDGGAVYTAHNVTITGTIIVNSRSKSGSGGAIYGLNIEVTNSTLSCNRANRNGGAVYAVQNIAAVNSTFNNSTASTGNGGAIYGGNDVTIINNCTISESLAAEKGGAIYSGAGESNNIFNPNNVVLSRSTFRSNSATSGGVLYTTGHYHHRVKFTDSTFVLNEAVNGGVAYIENSSLSITNSMFNNNEAAIHGGVLEVAFTSVSVRDTSLSHNNAGNNGGVFYGQNYSTNFTIAHTIIDHNSAQNGGVFNVRRSNSNIKIVDSELIGNSASNQGGAMDIRGVTLTIDVDTIIANNTAGNSGNVISACISKITAYGLEAQLDPVYPLYCSIYDEGNGSRSHPMSQTVSTDASTTIPTTEHIGTTSHEPTYDAESLMTTISEGVTTNEEIATTTSFASTSQSSSAATFTSDSSGALHTHSPYEVTTSSPADTTSQPPSENDPTTTYSERTTMSNPHVTDALATIVSTETQSNTNEVRTISEDTTTAASVTETTSSSPIKSTSHDGHQDSTTLPTEFEITTITAITTSMTDSPAYFSESTITTIDMDSSATTDPNKFAVLQAEQDKYNVWQSSQHNLLQVAIISLTVLCIVCTAVCVMMVTLFFVACKRRKGPRLITRGRYKKLSPTDKDQEGSPKDENEIEEYSFSEI